MTLVRLTKKSLKLLVPWYSLGKMNLNKEEKNGNNSGKKEGDFCR